jgi:hypothetical protein
MFYFVDVEQLLRASFVSFIVIFQSNNVQFIMLYTLYNYL